MASTAEIFSERIAVTAEIFSERIAVTPEPIAAWNLPTRTRRDRDMTADATNLLAEIRRSGGDLRLVGCDRLRLVAPKALLPELTDRVRAAKPTLLAALADTASKVSTAQEGGEGVSTPGATVQQRNTQPSSLPRIAPTAALLRPTSRGNGLLKRLSCHRRSSAARLGRS